MRSLRLCAFVVSLAGFVGAAHGQWAAAPARSGGGLGTLGAGIGKGLAAGLRAGEKDMAPCCTPHFVNAADYGAVGDWAGGSSGTDNTLALQLAIFAACASGADPSGLWLPPGAYRVTGTLTVPGARGFRMAGSGRWTFDAGVNLGSLIVADHTGAVLSLDGTNGFSLKDFSIRGNTEDKNTRAKWGLRLKPVLGYGTGSGLVENVTIAHCANGIACGNGGPNYNAADVSFLRCEVGFCDNGFIAEQSQQVNYDFYGCTFGFMDTALYLQAGGGITATLLATYDVRRLVYVGQAGDNIGSTTIVHAKLDGNAHRTILYEMGPNAIGAQATFIDVRQITGTPAGGARIKLGPYSTFHLIGGRNLCNHNQGGGPLFDLTSTAGGHSSILVEDTAVPGSAAAAVGTLTGANCHYRFRNCINESNANFVADLTSP